MPIYNIQDSKFTAETISILQDFSTELGSNTIVGAPTILISLLTGIDPTPYSILYGTIQIHNGTVVEQRIREGVPGCIYSIVYSLLSSDGEVYTKETFLAILPLAGNAEPVFKVVYLTTPPYPIDVIESITDTALGINGNSVTPQLDKLSDFATIISGFLRNPLVPYTFWPAEAVSDSASITSGSIVVILIQYQNGLPEGVSDLAVIMSGILTRVLIQYQNWTPEGVSDTATIRSGSLV